MMFDNNILKGIKALLLIGFVGLAGLNLSGCKESLPKNFDKIEGIYFNNLNPNRTHTDKIAVTFIYEDNDQMLIPIKLQLLGRPSDQDRIVNLIVDSDNAEMGVDYELPAEAVIKAGETTSDYIVTLHRTEALQLDEKLLRLHLEANENFIIPFTTITQAGSVTTSACDLTLSFSDKFTAPPDGWETTFVGKFSQQKFELIVKVIGISKSDFTVRGKITQAKWFYIQEQMISYVKTQQKQKENGETYDEDAFDEDGNPLKFAE